MSKKDKKYRVQSPTGGYDHVSSSANFYHSGPTERPLADPQAASDSDAVRRTGRHEAISNRPEGKMDPREVNALLSILRIAVLIVALGIGFFLLKKGIGLYEESIWMETAASAGKPAVLEEMQPFEQLDAETATTEADFKLRVELWEDADRLVRSADQLMQRNILVEAINRCLEALQKNPMHEGALQRLGDMYLAQEQYVEAINAYIRLLSIDTSKMEVRKNLTLALSGHGDLDEVKYMAEWYLAGGFFDLDVQRCLANAYFEREEYDQAVTAFRKVLEVEPKDMTAMEKESAALLETQRYEEALKALQRLRELNYRNPIYYKQIAICQAQLLQDRETVETLIRATQLFGQNTALSFIKEPLLDPVREERAFEHFVARVGGENFQLEVEELAKRLWAEREKEMAPQFDIPQLSPELKEDILKSK